jgi:hypothetical protein
MTPFVEPDTIEDEDEETSLYEPTADPVTETLGASGFVDRYTLDECVERFDETHAARFPETFDRFYFDGPEGRVLVDIVSDGSKEERVEAEIRKHTRFKTDWCDTHDGWRYVVVPESALVDVAELRRIVTGAPAPRVSRPANAGKAAKRGQIQRPKATN